MSDEIADPVVVYDPTPDPFPNVYRMLRHEERSEISEAVKQRVAECVQIALGQATMAWVPVPRGEFQSSDVSKIAADLLDKIQQAVYIELGYK